MKEVDPMEFLLGRNEMAVDKFFDDVTNAGGFRDVQITVVS